jgi:3-hydroxyisobutyrate dehydrogenase-like beta-hydroxyacid dehydrogenase
MTEPGVARGAALPCVGFIGLGDIGRPMAERLLRRGVSLVVHNRTRARADELGRLGADAADSPAAVAARAGVVITCLHGPDADRAVYLGANGITSVDLAGTVIVNTSTIGPSLARDLAESVARRDGAYLDVPLLGGGREAAAEGRLVLPVGGAAADLDRVRSVLAHLAAAIVAVGPVGSAQVVKLVNNMQVGVAAAALAQAVSLARAAGADLDAVREILPLASSRSRSMDRYLEPMLTGAVERRGTLRTLGKDLELALDLAAASGVGASVLGAAAGLFRQAVHSGLGDLDVPALVQVTDVMPPG